jgi:carboxymethylenebutenolidase
MPKYQETLQIQPDDPRLDSKYITYNSPKGGGEIKGLLSMPAGHQKPSCRGSLWCTKTGV